MTAEEGRDRAAASSCSYCPLCIAIDALRERRPEVVDHLAAAARELVAAAALLVDEHERGERRAGGDGTGRLRRIDLS